MTQLESNQGDRSCERPAAPAPKPWKRILTRGITVAAIIVVSVYLQALARNLWHEWRMLQQEVRESQRHVTVGYLEIAPLTSYARPPEHLYRDEGGETLLWSRWEPRVGHRWFRFKHGEIDTARIIRPASYSASRAIDYPLVENGGGTIWRRIPSDAAVVGYTLQGRKCVYPAAVLSKVQVVNDVVEEHPFLIVDNLLAPRQEAFSVFEAGLDGRRLTMGVTGYFQDGKPLLFDRGTESLWLEQNDDLLAVAGKYNKKRLARVARLVPVTWSSWLSRNGQSRLLVGADRSRGIPKE